VTAAFRDGDPVDLGLAARLDRPGGNVTGVVLLTELGIANAAAQTADTNAVHDRLLQSMRVRFSDSEQWSSPVKPPRSQNYVKSHDARTRVHVAHVVGWGTKMLTRPPKNKL